MNKYSEFNNYSLEFLLDEAVEEEKRLIPLKERKIKERLIDFRKYFLESELSANTFQDLFFKSTGFLQTFWNWASEFTWGSIK